MRRAFLFALGVLLLAGCSHFGRKSPVAGDLARPGTLGSKEVGPSPVQVVGRIVAIEPTRASVVVEVGVYAVLPTDFAKRILISRTDDLRPTARLQSSAYLRGRMLGTRLLAGRPQIGDEVVLAPDAP
jgi:hypothetical protein